MYLYIKSFYNKNNAKYILFLQFLVLIFIGAMGLVIDIRKNNFNNL